MSIQPRLLGPYALQQSLGKDELNEVWRAIDTRQQFPVAVNLLTFPAGSTNDVVARFTRETQVLPSLRHPHIVPIHAVQPIDPNVEGAHAAIVMDYIDGGSLSDYVQSRAQSGGPLSPTEIIRILAPIGDALDYAHQQGVIHGLLKPTSILLRRQDAWEHLPGKPCLAGFGLHNTLNPQVLSRKDIAYVAPEVLQGYTENVRSDLYSLGVVLYEMCTGRPPFEAQNTTELVLQVKKGSPPAPALFHPALSPDLTAVLMRALAREPGGRFSSAWAMIAAVARALRVSLQGTVNSSGFQQSGENAVIDLRGNSPGQSVVADPSIGVAGMPNASPITPLLAPMASTKQPGALANVEDQETRLLGYGAKPPVQPSGRRKVGRFYVALVALVLLALIGSSVAAWWFIIRPASLIEPVGRVFFVSSGLVNTKSNTGITDRIQVELQRLTPPQEGNRYYAWLLGDSETTGDILPVLVGELTVKDGKSTLTYEGDGQNVNLLSKYSRFLVTEEQANVRPANPSLDGATWRYYAGISREPIPGDTVNRYSLLDHIRHLVSQDPKLKSVEITGGLDTWLYRNTLKIMEWSGSARDAANGKNIQLMRRHLVRILDYLLGSQYVVTAGIPEDLPPILVDPVVARVALLTVSEDQNPTGYLKHIGTHLREISHAPGVTKWQRQQALDVHEDLNTVQSWLEQVRDHALTLIKKPVEELESSPETLTTLNTIFTLSHNAFVGELNPENNEIKEGVAQIHYKIQSLATLDITPCTGNTENPCRQS